MSAAAVNPAVAAAIRSLFEAFGGGWTEVSPIQPLGLLLDLAGEGLRAQLVTVSSGGEECVLRPDFTIPLALDHIGQGGRSGRYLYQGDAFRAGPDGAPTSFVQIGVEALGPSPDPAADDAALAALAWRASTAGGREDLQIRFGDVGLFRAVLTALALPAATVDRFVQALPTPRVLNRLLDRAQADTPPTTGSSRLAAMLADLPESEATAMLEELWRLAGIRPVGGRSAAEIVHRLAVRVAADRTPPLSADEAAAIRRYLAVSGDIRTALEALDGVAAPLGADLTSVLADWARRQALMAEAGLPLHRATFSAGFARPFGYYDGLLFEVTGQGSPDAVAAGGRYDGLPARLGGERGAVGCMVRPDRVGSAG